MLTMKIKHFLVLFLLTGLIWTSSLFFIANATDLTQTVYISSQEDIYTSHGVPFDLNVTMNTELNIAALQWSIAYDSTVFELLSISYDSVKYPNLIFNSDELGIISLSLSQVNEPLTGFQEFFSLTFRVISNIPYGDIDVLSINSDFDNEFVGITSDVLTSITNIVYDFNSVHLGLYGDLNIDGKVSIFDAAMLQLHLVGRQLLTPSKLSISDVNQDGEVNLLDVATIQLYAIGKIDHVGPLLEDGDLPISYYKLASGLYDLSNLPGEQKAILFAAAERYLLDNVYAGVPLYTRATRVMYSDRVQLFSPEYNGVLGFGTAFSQLSADDSTVKMFGDTFGTAGEYTWRASFNTDPTGLNPWMADDSNTATFTDHFNGSLYDRFFDESKKGFDILPSLAKSEPIPVNPTVINGKTYAKVWQIEIRDDLQWKYHPSTNVSALPAGHEVLNAEDYLWTWRYALENNWFRARTGGSDFVSQGIKNAAEFLAGNATWAEVGLRLATGKTNTIELEYVNEKSTFEIKYGFAGAVLTPINQQLFEALGEQYGMDPTKVASSGIYYFDTWTPGQLLTFKKNSLHPDAALYKYTGYQYRYVNGSDNIFAEFLAGRLESASVPASQINNYLNDPRVKTAPDATTWRLMINGFGSTDARDAYIAANPGVGIDDTWEPEPILSYLPMRQALFYGFDRYHAAVELVKLYLPAHTLFAPTYFIDAESGLSVRGTDAGQAVFDDFGGGSDGYFPDAAKDLFIDAVTAAIADGHYTAGTATNYTVITLQLYWSSSGNTSAQMMVANLIEQYEALLVDDVNFVRLDIVENDVAFPNNYYDYMMVAKMDLGIGGISGSLLDAPSFMDVFSDDNRGGFTLNWGIDTTTANIPVIYYNENNKKVYEIWSYNALIEALQGRVNVEEGQEQKTWSSTTDLITAYTKVAYDEVVSITVNDQLMTYLLTNTVEQIIFENGFDGLFGYIVTTEKGDNYYYIISHKDDKYSLFIQEKLFTTASAAISADLATYGAYELVTSTGPLTDAEILSNAYIQANYTFDDVAGAAAMFGIPAQYTEVYAISWKRGTASAGTDGYVLLHIGNYYIAVAWL